MADENAEYNKDADGQPITLETQAEEDGRRFSPSTGRNKGAVRETFGAHMPHAGAILEIGSGTGEHGVYITDAQPGLRWTFTDNDAASLGSAKAWMGHAARASADRALVLDASTSDWGAVIENERFDGVFCANVIHISPIEVAAGLFKGARRVLAERGRLFLYGPFARHGEMSEGNGRFDIDLKRRDARWGVRDLEREIVPMAERAGFVLVTIVEMPANNLSVVFERG